MTPPPSKSMSMLQLRIANDMQSEEIALLKRENELLRKMLEEVHIEARNNMEKLEAISQFNSHTVRGTLTRVWGLACVIRNSQSLAEVKELAELLTGEAFKLDKVIRQVASSLFKTGDHPHSHLKK